MTPMVAFLIGSPTTAPTDPLTFWVPAGAVLIAAVINVGAVIVATRLAGSNSDRSLARTIEADRQGRILERQLDLYGEILNFVSARKQKRDEMSMMGTIEGVEAIDAFDPTELFRLIGRAESVAHLAVLEAFESSNSAQKDWAVEHNVLWHPALAQARTKAKFDELEALRQEADLVDERLKLSIRSALHTGKEELDAYAYFSRRNDVLPDIDAEARQEEG